MIKNLKDINVRLLALAAAIVAFYVLSVQASTVAALPPCQRAALSFLNHPGSHTFSALAGTDEARCWLAIGSSESNLQRLTSLVQSGNPLAAQYLGANLSHLDGGYLEDSLRALGEFSKHNMVSILLLAHKGQISMQSLTDSLTMLPLSFSDDPAAQLRELMTRKDLLMRVKRADVADEQATAVKAINDFMNEIRATTSPSTKK